VHLGGYTVLTSIGFLAVSRAGCNYIFKNQKYKNYFHGAIQTIEISLSYINFALL
jgi:hypothetical protein